MKRPFLWMLVFFISGILFGEYGQTELLWVYLFFAFAGGVLLCFVFRRAEPFLFPFAAMLGVFLLQNTLAAGSLSLEALAEEKASIAAEGMVIDSRTLQSGYLELSFQMDSLQANGGSIAEGAKLRVMVPPEKWTQKPPAYGQFLTVEGKLLPLSVRSNPGEFDEARYYWARGFSYKMFAEKITPGGMAGFSVSKAIWGLANRFNEVYDAVFPEAEAGIVKAMITGDKDGLLGEFVVLYKEAGIYHILAISGLHISILACFVRLLLRKGLRLSLRISAFGTLLFLLFYMVFAGCSVSVVRTVVMWTVLMMGVVVFREPDVLNNLSIAAFLLLLYEPLYLWDAGFLLSFSSVTGVLMGAQLLDRMPSMDTWPVLAFFRNSIVISASAYLFSTPIALYFFYVTSPSSILLNILLLPFMGFVIGMSMAVGVVGFFSIPAATFLGGSVFLVLRFFELFCRIAVRLFGILDIGHVGVLPILCYYGCMLTILLAKNRRAMAFGVPAFLSLFLFSALGNRFLFQRTKVTFLDVGQGDCAVIETYDNQTVVVDGGGKGTAALGENTGIKTLIPFLQYEGVKSIDLLFISHMDRDHAAGALELMLAFPVRAVVVSEYEMEESELNAVFSALSARQNIPVYTMRAGQKITLGAQTEIDCVYPLPEGRMQPGDNNHGSLVFQFLYGGTGVLFTGDIGFSEEEEILQTGQEIRADVLKVAHHGSAGSSGAAFLEASGCSLAAYSCSESNVYGHPSAETLSRLLDAGMECYGTPEDGAVQVFLDGRTVSVKTTKRNGDQ